jgi:hypothetical protein
MSMGENLEGIARLEPAVRSAMRLRGSTGAVDPNARRREGKDSPPAPPSRFTIEQYTAGLNKEIEDNFLIRNWEKNAIVQKLSETYGPRYSRDDLVWAVDLANKLNYRAVFTQSSYGNGDEGIAELEKQVPGFSRGLYAELLGYMSYINR